MALRTRGIQSNTYDPAAILLTPYYRTLASVDYCPEQLEDANYTPYQLFCLQTRLAPHLPPGVVISFPTIEDVLESGVQIMRVILVLSSPQSKEDQERLQGVVGKIIGEFPTHCALYNTQDRLFVGRKSIPRQWIRTMLPYLEIPERYNPFIEDGLLLVDLSQDFNYDDVHQELTLSLIQQLQTHYRDGVIVCSQDFAQRWGLISHSDGDYGLHRADWNEPTIIRDRTQFLLDRLHGLRWCRFHLKTVTSAAEEQSTWHRIVEGLRDLSFPLDGIIFSGCGILIDSWIINNLEILQQVGAIFYQAWMRSHFDVETIPVRSLDHAQEVKDQLLNDRSLEDIVIYNTGDRLRPYTVSYK